MYTRIKTSKNSPRKTVQIVESFLNDKGQPRQRIVQHLGVACDEEQLQKLWAMAENLIPELERRAREEKLLQEGKLPLFECAPEDYETEIPPERTARVKAMLKRGDVLEGPFEVWGEVFDRLGIEDVLGLSDRGRGATNALRLCLTAKLAEGGSKRRSALWVSEQMGFSLAEDRFYRMMDKLADKTGKVKELAFMHGRKLCDNKISLLLFDVTTLYFESFLDDEDEEKHETDGEEETKTVLEPGLRRHGFSKDCKFKETQVVLALAASPEGIPLWYDVFPGNKAECSTLKHMVDEVTKLLAPDETWIVADNAMLTAENRKLLEDAKIGYVLGAGLRKLPKGEREEALNRDAFSELDEDRTYRTLQLKNGNTLVVTYSETKARKDAHDREQMLEKLRKKLDKRGQVKVKALISNRGKSKYVEPCEEGAESSYRLNQAKIDEEARYDGLHGVETDRPVETLDDVKAVLGAYGNLWHIEDCFRVSKTNLKIRPIYHWTPQRIQAHVAICFLALLMERYLETHLWVRRHVKLSAQRIKDALLKVNSTLIVDTDNDKLYRFPSRLPHDAREIYKALDLKRKTGPTEITSLVNYRRRIPNLREEADEGTTTNETAV